MTLTLMYIDCRFIVELKHATRTQNLWIKCKVKMALSEDWEYEGFTSEYFWLSEP